MSTTTDGAQEPREPDRSTGQDFTDELYPLVDRRLLYFVLLVVAILAALVSLEFCQSIQALSGWAPGGLYCTYTILLVIAALLLLYTILWYPHLVQEHRKVDPSSVRYLLLQGRNIVADRRREDYASGREREKPSEDADLEALDHEVARVSELSPDNWNEYEILQLKELVVPFWTPHDLIESAADYLAELQDYAEDSKYRYEWKQLNDRQRRVEQSIDILDERLSSSNKDISKDSDQGDGGDDEQSCISPNDSEVKRLRAMVIALLNHITDYQHSWAVGSAMIRALTTYGSILAGIFIFMGILPLIHPQADWACDFTVINWATLGSAGALTAALQVLRKEQAVEVGYSEGKQEIRKCMLGVILGLASGIIIFAMIIGGLLSGEIVPNIKDQEVYEWMDVGKAIFWAFGAGYSFERVFDRVKSSGDGVRG